MSVTVSGTSGLTFNNGSTQTTGAGFGSGSQVWNVITGSRASGVTYTNSFGYPIMVCVAGSSSGSGANHNLNVYINGTQITYTTQFAAGNDSPQITFSVPPGATYRVDITGTGLSLGQWAELY